MNRIGGVWKVQWKEWKGFVFQPWLTLFTVFVVTQALFYVASSSDGMAFNGAAFILFIYGFVYSIVLVSQSFPFLIGMSVSRKDFFYGTTFVLIASSLLNGAIFSLLSGMERITGYWWKDQRFFDYPYLTEGSFFPRLVVLSLLLLVYQMFGFFLGCLHRRFKSKGVWLFFIISILVMLAASYVPEVHHLGDEFMEWGNGRTAFELSLLLLPLIVLLAACSRLLIRRADA